MRKINCALCNSKDNFKILHEANFSLKAVDKRVFSARRLPDRLHYRIVKCRQCGLIRSHPILAPKKIASLYKQSRMTYQAEIPYLRKTYGSYLKKTAPLLTGKNNLLEIGCGSGFFLEEALTQGFKNVHGVEPGREIVKEACKKLQEHILIDFFHQKLFPKNFFDLVCCFHTLDHIVHLNTFIKDVYQVLKPGGYVFFIVHDVNSPGAILFKDKWPIFDIEHIWLFNKTTLGQIFKKHKFEIIKIFNVRNTYPLYYWLRMSPLPRKIKSSLINLLEKTHLAKIPITLLAGNIGLVARK